MPFLTNKDPHNRDEDVINERSSLIAAVLPPSPGSTKRPSMTNIDADEYGTAVPLSNERNSRSGKHIKSDSVGSLEFLLSEAQESPVLQKRLSGGQKRFQFARRGIFVGVLLIVIGALTAFRHAPVSSPEERDPTRDPFSTLDPRWDLGLYDFQRGLDSSPPKKVREATGVHQALPTNAWYENFLLARGEPDATHRVYTTPYVVDVVGPVPGLRLHAMHIDATQNVVQLSTVDSYSMTLGAASAVTRHGGEKKQLSKEYSIVSTTPLGITLEWDAYPMRSSIVRGMPYATMHYPRSSHDKDELLMLPTIASEVSLLGEPLVDGKPSALCSDSNMSLMPVERELQLTFDHSDFTWLVFFSEPVHLWCTQNPEGDEAAKVILQVTDAARIQESSGIPARNLEDLTVRVALLSNCTTGVNPIHCTGGQKPASSTMNHYGDILRKYADFYPGPNSDVSYSFEDGSDEATVKFNWDVREASRRLRGHEPSNSRVQLRQAEEKQQGEDKDSRELIMFALPHHMDILSGESVAFNVCTPSLIGPTCLVSGNEWVLDETMPATDFRAPRPPRAETLTSLVAALHDDIKFRLPNYYRRGAGDTYFSGKMLAKAGRILMIADELQELCAGQSSYDEQIDTDTRLEYTSACSNVDLPSTRELSDMLSALRDSVEVWINGKADVPFIYDSAWGGVLSCGCNFDPKTSLCRNSFPDCPVASDPGLNFGNGFYNDHHFHYGYHIYAAAVVAHFDPSWGRKHFEQVLLLIRDIANPSHADLHFPVFRHKDWFQGNSWASGVSLPAYLNGRNQESSSEAIASYEAVALFGKVMVGAWNETDDEAMMETSARIRDIGKLLTATEIRAADRYWHVRLDDADKKIYPSIYKENAIGIMWNTMAQFQTWFGNNPYLPYGIQLLPLTPVAESRDDPQWLREMYAPFADACDGSEGCVEQGWSVLQFAVLASVGHIDLAMQRSLAIPSEVFDSAGGNGHSLTNTLWYVATRPDAVPLELPKAEDSPSTGGTIKLVDCGVPTTCTNEVLDAEAKGYSCRDRITYLIQSFAKSESEACFQVGGDEYPEACGGCNPCAGDAGCPSAKNDVPNQCPPCTEKECSSDLNRCPLYDRTFVCSGGSSTGGCSPFPWELHPVTCSTCCELTDCHETVNGEQSTEIDDTDADEDDARCPPCSDEVCNGRLNLCPVHEAPFLCIGGENIGGCSPEPWDLENTQCAECCRLQPGCRRGT